MSYMNRKRDRRFYETSAYQPKNLGFSQKIREQQTADKSYADSFAQDLDILKSVNDSQKLEDIIKAQLKTTRTTIRRVEELVKRRQQSNAPSESTSLKNRVYSQTYIPPVLGCPDITPSYLPSLSDEDDENLTDIEKETDLPVIKRQKCFDEPVRSESKSLSRKLFGFVDFLFSNTRNTSVHPRRLFKGIKLLSYFSGKNMNQHDQDNIVDEESDDDQQMYDEASSVEKDYQPAVHQLDNDTTASVASSSITSDDNDEIDDDYSDENRICNTIFPRNNDFCDTIGVFNKPQDEQDESVEMLDCYKTPVNVDVSSLESSDVAPVREDSIKSVSNVCHSDSRDLDDTKDIDKSDDMIDSELQQSELEIVEDVNELPRTDSTAEVESLLDISCKSNVDLALDKI